MSKPKIIREMEPQKNWEDEYKRLQEKFIAQKQLLNEQEDHIKMLHVKTRKIERAFTALERQQGGDGTALAKITEDETLITTLYERIAKLETQNTEVMKRNKHLTDVLEKKKKQIASLERQVNDSKRMGGRKPLAKDRPKSATEINVVAARTMRQEPIIEQEPEVENTNNQQLLELVKSYKARLEIAEQQLALASSDNARLRELQLRDSSNQDYQKVNMNDELSSQVRDLKWKLQQLQTQHDHVSSKASAHLEGLKTAEDQLEDQNQRVRELRRALEDLRHEKEITDFKAARVDDLEETVVELKRSNRGLEEKIARLCEAPFISDAFGQHESRLEFEKVLAERQDYLSKIDHLQEAVRTQYSALVSLKQQAAKLREEKEEAEKNCDELRTRYSQLEAGTSLLQDKLRLYSGEDGVNIEDLERALTLIKRRSEPIGKLDFLKNADGFDDPITLPLLKKKAQEIQIINLNLTKEVERLENMLKIQTNINRDLNKELENFTHKKDKDKKELEQRAQDFEELAMKRLNKIHTLEAQLREVVYGLSKKKRGKHAGHRPQDQGDDLETISEVGTENVLLSELLEEKNGDIDPDENMLEVWVKGATIKDGVVVPGSSTFVVFDFFDYESQTTSIMPTSKPHWDFAATYKITVDDFFLRYLATDGLSFELNMATQGDYTMLARCTPPLQSLLKSKPLVRLEKYPMISPRTGEIIAHLEVDIRLALPVTELYRLFLERHPEEKKLIKDRSTKRVIEAANEIEKAESLAVNTLDDESRMYNELEVVVYNIQGLPKRGDGSSPSPYVHFQLLGHPDKFTNPAENTLNPTYNERFAFGMVTNDQQCRLLRRSQLLLTVIDMKGEEEESKDDTEGLIGEINVSLASLSEGNTILDSFTLKNNSGEHVGVMRIAVQWKYRFKAQRELGPRALSGVEVECLISSFSPGDGKDGLVEYNSFLRFIDPPLSVSRAMERIQDYIHKVTHREGLSPREILESITENSARITEDFFLSCFNRLEIDVLPDEWIQLFRYIDIGDNQSVSLDQVLAVLNLDEVAGVPPSLQEKLILQMRNLHSRGVNAKNMFQRADQWGDRGLVTRLEFKSVLKKMGFQLVDEPDDLEIEASRFDDKKPSSKLPRAEHDPLNDTMDSDDVLLPSSSHRGVNEDILRQKDIFEKKLAEIQQRTRQRPSQSGLVTPQPRGVNDSLNSEADDPGPSQVLGKNMLDQNPFPDGEHRSSVGRRNGGGDMTFDRSILDSSATKLQRSYRRFSARKKLHSSPSQPEDTSFRLYAQDPKITTINGPPPSGSESFQRMGILHAEDVLRDSLRALQGVQPAPNFLGTFLKVDRKQDSFLNRKQFAFVMSQFPEVRIPPEILRELMDYFDSSSDGSKIDYQAFCRFCNYRQLEILPAIKSLKHMVMSPNAILRFRALDAAGTGFLSRQEMLKVLSDLGFGHFTQKQILNILALFETRVDGHVNYSNLVEYVRDNSLSRSFDALCEKLKTLVTEKGGTQETNLRRWYRRFDKEGQGAVSLAGFIELLAEFDLQNYSKQVVSSVYNFINLDGQGNGISFQEFSTWVSSPIDLHLSMYTTTTKAEIQRKCHLYLVSLASYQETSLEELTQAYLLYDWKTPPSGMVGKGEFIRASIYAGFPLSHAELRSLSGEFVSHSDERKVLYKKFLVWATPSAGEPEVKASVTNMTAQSPHKRTAAIVRFLEQCVERKVDLQSVFGRYDATGTGRIASGEFASGLSDLGLSSVSQFDIMELADRFKAIAGDFILYRRIIAELLNQVDVRTGAADVDIVDVIKGAVLKRPGTLERLEDSFKYYDRKGTGRIQEEDLGTIFEEANIKLSRQELELFADKYSIGPSGWIQSAAFLSTLNSRLGKGPTSEVSRAVHGLPDDVANKVSWLLETLILKGKDFRTELDTFDDRFTGGILQADFREVFQERFRAGFAQRDLEILEKVYRDRSDPRKVNFVKLLQELHPRNLKATTPEVLNLLEVAENLRSKIRKRCDYLSPGELNRPFRHFARKRFEAGFTQEEFSIALKDLGINLAWDQEKSLFEMINIDGGKAVRYNNFVVFICDPHHEDVIWKLRRGIRRARISDVELLETIEEQDPNDSGLITSKQFMKALRSSNIDMSEQDILRLMLRFDNEEAQRFDIRLFRRFLIGEDEHEDLRPLKPVTRLLVSENSPNRISAEATETRIITALRNRILDQLEIGATASDIFGIFDESNKGSVDMISFLQGARELGVTMTRAEGRNVLRRLSLMAGGIIDKLSFFEALELDVGKRKKKEQASVGFRIEEDEPPLGILRTLNSLAKQLRYSENEVRATNILRNAFESEDVDCDGYLNRLEFTRAISSVGSINSRETERLFEFLDKQDVDDGALKISFALAFITRNCRQKVDNSSNQEIDRPRRDRDRSERDAASIVFRKQPHLLEELTKMALSLKKKGRELKELFQDFQSADLTKRGDLDRIEFCDRLRMFGFNLAPEFERNLCDSLCSVSESNLIDYIGFISSLQSAMSEKDELDEVLTALRKNIKSKLTHGKNLSEIFDGMDRNGNGSIGLDELKIGLKKIGISINREEAQRIGERFSTNGGPIRYRDFVRVLAPRGRSEENYVAHLVDRIRSSLKDRFGSESLSIQRVKSVFADIDINGDGLLSIREFGNGMASLKVDLETDDIKQIFEAFDTEGIGKLRYKDFIDLLGGVKSLDRKMDVDDIVEVIRKRLEDSLGFGGNASRKIREAFQDADLNNDRVIDKREFKKVMDLLGVKVSNDEVRSIYQKFDRNGDGSFNYAEFLKLTGYDEGSTRPRKRGDSDNVDDIVEVIRKRLEDSLGFGGNASRKIREAFKEADADNSRSIDKREFKRAMGFVGVELSGPEIRGIFERFDRNGSGNLDYSEFLNLLGFEDAPEERKSSSAGGGGGKKSFRRL